MITTLLEPRRNTITQPLNPRSATIGAAMLWVSWFVFYSGSQLATEGVATMALTLTHILAATASLTRKLGQHRKYGKVSLVGMVSDNITGLATITAT